MVLGLCTSVVMAVMVTLIAGRAGASPAWPSVTQAAQVVGPVNPQSNPGSFLTCPSATTCFKVGSVPGGDGSVPLIESLSGGSWTLTDGPVPADASTVNAGVQMSAISCSSSSFCLAVGSYQDTDNVQAGLLLTMSGGLWTAARAPVPADAATDGQVTDNTEHTYVDAVSCWTDGGCAVAGSYMLASGSYADLADNLSAGNWSSTLTSDLNGKLTSVACDPTGTCVAGGPFVPSGSPFSAIRLVTDAGGTWSTTAAPFPAGSGSTLTAIACPATDACTAVGSYADQNGSQQALLLQQSITGWTGTTVAVPGESTAANRNPWVTLDALSCPAAGSCVADGTYQDGNSQTYGVVFDQTPARWTAQQAPLPPDNEVGSPSVSFAAGSLSCPAAGQCTAVGTYTTQASTDTTIGRAGMVLTQSDGSWVFATQQAWPTGYVPGEPDSLVSGDLYSVSCPADDTCWAEGDVKNDDADTGNTYQSDVESIATTRPAVGALTPAVATTPASTAVTPADVTSYTVTLTGDDAGGSPGDPVSLYLCGPTAVPTPCTTFSNPLGEVMPTSGPGDTSTLTSPPIQEGGSGYWCAAAYYYGDSAYGPASDLTTDGCFDVAPTITSADTTQFTAGVAAAPFDVTAGPDAAPVSFGDTGALPPGVTLSSAGVLGGTPVTAGGDFPVTITATDTTGHSATQDFVLDVLPSTSLLVVTASPLAAATVGTPYSVTLAATGGGARYKWKLVSSRLPKGLKLNKKTGTISGTPKAHARGTAAFEVQVKSGAATATADFSITVS
ncbi:MAG: Ig domain-containing protein [Acidimicrobiales bacterium]